MLDINHQASETHSRPKSTQGDDWRNLPHTLERMKENDTVSYDSINTKQTPLLALYQQQTSTFAQPHQPVNRGYETPSSKLTKTQSEHSVNQRSVSCTWRNLTEPNQTCLSQLVTDNTQTITTSKLIFSKEVPIYEANDSNALRNLDSYMEKWMRFELELTPDNMIHIAVYDSNDPVNSLFFCVINKEKFEMIQAQQNLVIEQFSKLAGHIINLFNACIQNFKPEPSGSNSANLTRFICAFKQRNDSMRGIKGSQINCSIYQQSPLTHLLHIELMLEPATDLQAREWLSRKFQISQSIIYQLLSMQESLHKRLQKQSEANIGIQLELKSTVALYQNQIADLNENFRQRTEDKQQNYETSITQATIRFQTEKETLVQSHTRETQDLTSQIQKLRAKLDEQNNIRIQLETQSEIQLQKLQEQALQLTQSQSVCADRDSQLNLLTKDFNFKDKENLRTELLKEEMVRECADLKQRLSLSEQKISVDEKEIIELRFQCDRLENQLESIEQVKSQLEIKLQSFEDEVTKQKQKKADLKQDKRNLKAQIKDLELKVQQISSSCSLLSQEVIDGKEKIEISNKKITELKKDISMLSTKLSETADTLKSNTETISYLNKQLNEAQKFSFRALVSNTTKRDRSNSASEPSVVAKSPLPHSSVKQNRCQEIRQQTERNYQRQSLREFAAEEFDRNSRQVDLKLTEKYAKIFGYQDQPKEGNETIAADKLQESPKIAFQPQKQLESRVLYSNNSYKKYLQSVHGEDYFSFNR